MSRILFVGLCLVGIAVALFAEQSNYKANKEQHKIVKAEKQQVFR